MQNTSGRPRMSPLFIALAGISLALASFGYFRLFVDFASMPSWLAAFAVGGLDLAAVLIGKHALDVAEDGDSSAPWNFALIMLTLLGSFAQFSHALLAGQPVAVGIVSAAFPVVTVLLFEGQLRRVYRLNGRRSGRLAMPRATVDLVTWLFFRRLALRATKLAVLDRGLDTDSALTIAERQLDIELMQSARPPKRRELRRTYAAELNSGQVVEVADEPESMPIVHRPPNPHDDPPNGGGQPADEPDITADEPSDVTDVRRRGDLARAVDDAREIVGDDPERIVRIVRLKYPDAHPDNIRRTLARRLAG